MLSLRRWLACASVGLLVSSIAGCAASADDSAESTSADLSASCGLDPMSPDSPRKLMNDPMRDPADAQARLRCLSEELTLQHDGRAPFASLYSDITDSARKAIAEKRFEDNEWLERYMTEFAELYRVSFVGYIDGHGDEIPASWRISFDAARDPHTLVAQAVSLGVNAHVDRDLSHALVAVGIGEDHETREMRKRDHFKVNDILKENVDAALKRLADTYAPGFGQAPDIVMKILTETYFGAVVTGRFKAWLDAVALHDTPALLRPAEEAQIELSSKLLAEAVLVPSLSPELTEKLHELEAGH
jgi:hypothetical protein